MMKSITLKLLALGCFLSILMNSCKKDEEIPSAFSRISLEKSFSGTQQTSSASYQYKDDKLIRKYLTVEGGSEETIISYPEENKIIVSETKTYDPIGTFKSTLEITFSGSDVKEIDYKNEKHCKFFHYNSDGTIDKIIDSAYFEGGDILYITSFSYESGKLVQIFRESPGYHNGSKLLYIYKGDTLKEIVTYSELDPGWVETEKNTYSFTEGRISNITHYYGNTESWDESYSSYYTYDSRGYLVKVEESYPGKTEKGIREYVYENGSGNYQKIFYHLVYDNTLPMPDSPLD